MSFFSLGLEALSEAQSMFFLSLKADKLLNATHGSDGSVVLLLPLTAIALAEQKHDPGGARCS